MNSLYGLFFAICRKILFFWVKTEVIGNSKDQLELDPDKPVCYVIQNQSFSSQLVLEQECIRAGLPSSRAPISLPEIPLRGSLFFMFKRKGSLFWKRQSPTVTTHIKQLVHAAKVDPSFDVQLVPVSLFWGRNPEKENSWFKLLVSDSWAVAGKLQKFIIILVHGRQTFLQFNTPISLRQVVDEVEQPDEELLSRKLARVLRVHFRRVRQAVLGPDLSHRRTLVNSLLRSPAVKDAIRETAKNEGIEPEKVKARALKYGDEIASNVSMPVVRFLDRLLTWVWNKIYNGVIVSNIQIVQEVAKDNAVVYVPCHRSHIDYLLLSYVLFKNGIMVPHIAAGINLNMPVIGGLLRRGGAFFMRRSFKDNKLYSTIFNEYIHQMFLRGYSVEYFIEGGRSRTGRTLNPRPGMVAMTVRSFLRDHTKPIVFVPVYTSYEKVLEGRTYLGELRGQKKQKESIFGVVSSLKNLRKSFGQVRVNFGKPIFLADFLDQAQPQWRKQAYNAEYRPDWLNDVVEDLATDIATHINDASAVNPINMAALILLSTPRQAMGKTLLANQMDAFRALLAERPYSESVTFPEGNGVDWIDYSESMGLVVRQPQSLGDIISLEGSNAILMTYYRNNILHLFAIPSLIAALFQNTSVIKRDLIVEKVKHFYPYLKAELFLHWNINDIQEVTEHWIDALLSRAWLSEEGGQLYRPASSSEEYVRLNVLARFITQTIERYYMTLAILRRAGSSEIDAKELEEQSTELAQRMSILFGLNAPEFFDKALFHQFIRQLKSTGVLQKDDENKLIFGDRMDVLMEDAKLMLNAELRQAIQQVTMGPTTS
jgi:glycerol-3-phosphate O-acyltransferase